MISSIIGINDLNICIKYSLISFNFIVDLKQPFGFPNSLNTIMHHFIQSFISNPYTLSTVCATFPMQIFVSLYLCSILN